MLSDLLVYVYNTIFHSLKALETIRLPFSKDTTTDTELTTINIQTLKASACEIYRTPLIFDDRKQEAVRA